MPNEHLQQFKDCVKDAIRYAELLTTIQKKAQQKMITEEERVEQTKSHENKLDKTIEQRQQLISVIAANDPALKEFSEILKAYKDKELTVKNQIRIIHSNINTLETDLTEKKRKTDRSSTSSSDKIEKLENMLEKEYDTLKFKQEVLEECTKNLPTGERALDLYILKVIDSERLKEYIKFFSEGFSAIEKTDKTIDTNLPLAKKLFSQDDHRQKKINVLSTAAIQTANSSKADQRGELRKRPTQKHANTFEH